MPTTVGEWAVESADPKKRMTRRQSETEPATKFAADVDGRLSAALRLRNHLARLE